MLYIYCRIYPLQQGKLFPHCSIGDELVTHSISLFRGGLYDSLSYLRVEDPPIMFELDLDRNWCWSEIPTQWSSTWTCTDSVKHCLRRCGLQPQGEWPLGLFKWLRTLEASVAREIPR